MQLTLAFLTPPDQPTETSRIPAPWDQLDEVPRLAALEILARLIVRMLAAEPEEAASDD